MTTKCGTSKPGRIEMFLKDQISSLFGKVLHFLKRFQFFQFLGKNLVVTRIYSDVVSNDGWKSLISIANTTMVLYSDEKERCICSWTHFKKSGDRQSKVIL